MVATPREGMVAKLATPRFEQGEFEKGGPPLSVSVFTEN